MPERPSGKDIDQRHGTCDYCPVEDPNSKKDSLVDRRTNFNQFNSNQTRHPPTNIQSHA
jgi:hypothetical protein